MCGFYSLPRKMDTRRDETRTFISVWMYAIVNICEKKDGPLSQIRKFRNIVRARYLSHFTTHTKVSLPHKKSLYQKKESLPHKKSLYCKKRVFTKKKSLYQKKRVFTTQKESLPKKKSLYQKKRVFTTKKESLPHKKSLYHT